MLDNERIEGYLVLSVKITNCVKKEPRVQYKKGKTNVKDMKEASKCKRIRIPVSYFKER